MGLSCPPSLLLLLVPLCQSFCPSCLVTREGARLVEQLEDGTGREFTFSGVNIFWLGSSQDNPDIPGGPAPSYQHPSQYRLDDVLFSAMSMGARVVRSHSLGISTGTGAFHAYGMGWREGAIWPELGGRNGSQENFVSMDYAIYRAGQLGLRLVIPLTNGWNYANGGMLDFLGWRGLAGLCLDDLEDNDISRKGQRCEDEFYTNSQVVEDFREYVATILNHVNPHTGLAYRDDPTILAWESGNELHFPPFQWTVDLATYIKEELGARQLFMDGKHVSATGVGWYPELDSPILVEQYRAVVDIVSDHSYPMDAELTEQLATRSVLELGLPFVVGEVGWTQELESALPYLTKVEELRGLGLLSGSLFWSMMGHAQLYGHVTHRDGFSIYWPNGPQPEVFSYDNPSYRSLMLNFSSHMHTMSGRAVPPSYPLDISPPLITTLECRESQWIRIAFRGVAGAHLYKVSVDGVALAFIEDRQSEPTYIHNSVVQQGSTVTVRPFGYGEELVEGSLSEEEPCVWL